jgi:hypothetical protein
MALEFDARPDEVRVVDVQKTWTSDGQPCEVLVEAEYLSAGEVVGNRRLNISPGLLAHGTGDTGPIVEEPVDWDSEENGDFITAQFTAIHDGVPPVSDTVKATIRALIPDSIWAWRWGK